MTEGRKLSKVPVGPIRDYPLTLSPADYAESVLEERIADLSMNIGILEEDRLSLVKTIVKTIAEREGQIANLEARRTALKDWLAHVR